jgi:hypothetical protein
MADIGHSQIALHCISGVVNAVWFFLGKRSFYFLAESDPIFFLIALFLAALAIGAGELVGALYPPL